MESKFVLKPVMAAAACALLVLMAPEGIGIAQGGSQPAISSATGTISQGALITLSGSNLNAESGTNWDGLFTATPTAWSFEGSSPQADGFGAGDGVYDLSVRLIGNKSIKFHSAVSNPNCARTGGVGQSYNYLNTHTYSSDYWIRSYVRWNRRTNWPNNYMKMFNALEAHYYMQPSGAASGNPSSLTFAHDLGSGDGQVPSGAIENNRWYAVEAHWKTTSPRVFEVWMDGVRIYSATPSSSGSNLSTLIFGIINACGSASWDVEFWMDGFTVAGSRVFPSAIVEVGDNPNYASARKNVQALEKLSDNELVFRLNTTNLGAGPYYVWVRNNRQTLSGGIQLGSGQPTSSAPTAPSNLRIVS